MTAWRELDRRTRRDLLRRTGPHPDPVVACVAVGYARTMLGGRVRSRRLLRSLVFVPVFIVCAAIGATVAGPDRPMVAAALPIVIVVPMIVWLVAGQVRFRLRLIRMENANAPTLLAGEAPAPPPAPAPAPGTPLSVAYEPRAVLRQYGRTACLTVAIAVILPFTIDWLAAPALALFAVAWALMGYQLVRWVLPRRPVLVMDGDGVTFGTGLSVPWDAITEIRVHPLRAGNRPRHRVIAFVCADPRIPLERMSGIKRSNARRALTYYGSPLVVADRALDRTAEEIVAAATALHPVPVHRFAP
jgi:hypothetical protein